MKLDSPIFDRIRITPGEEREARPQEPVCDHEGCARAATHRAPMGRGREGRYHKFCLEHVQDYNKKYNYFSGMNDAELDAWSKAELTGHRPTWSMGTNPGNAGAGTSPRRRAPRNPWSAPPDDPFDLMGARRAARNQAEREAEATRRRVGNAARAAFETLGLDHETSADDIRRRYKDLVKRHHPDANGGDRSHEDRLRDIIQAYATLKAAGFTKKA